MLPDEAVDILDLAEAEMNERFGDLQEAKVRDIDRYNEQAAVKWPRILIVIDELASLMLADRLTAARVEGSIARLTGMSRAVGIHLLMATQRPTTDVCTGIIKANAPTRIAFPVMSALDSRVILDQTGAEALTEKGSMLVRMPALRTLMDIQGPYISEAQIEAAVTVSRTRMEG